jgi:GMP synthase-like glutamine amidotransferase
MAGYFAPEFEPLRVLAIGGEIPAGAAEWAQRAGAAGMVIGGSAHSPLDPAPWIAPLEKFVAGFVQTGLPALGICFGHEILCTTLGGRLVRRGGLTVALREVRLLKSDPLFAGLDGMTRQPVAHEVMAAGPPPGFITLGATDDCPIQAMRHESLPVWGVQFHPEMDRDIKLHDPDWLSLDDGAFAASDGPAVMRNFFEIVKKTAV